MSTSEFRQLLQTVADGWNQGKPTQVVSCFTENAIFSQPPDIQHVVGAPALFEYSGGISAKSNVMNMKWHRIFFDEEIQTGAGEYTFEMDNKNHGVAIIKLENNKISNWREYQWTGDLSWTDFVGENKF